MKRRRFISWLSGQSRPRNAERINVLLDSIPAETEAGIAPAGHEIQTVSVDAEALSFLS
jgi:hypothetical protein